MNKYKNYMCVILLVFTSCKEDNHEAYGSDGTPPGKVIINSIVNKPGGAVIKSCSLFKQLVIKINIIRYLMLLTSFYKKIFKIYF